MVIVLIGVIQEAVDEGWCSITAIFLLFVAGVFIVATLLHPKVSTNGIFSYLQNIKVTRILYVYIYS